MVAAWTWKYRHFVSVNREEVEEGHGSALYGGARLP